MTEKFDKTQVEQSALVKTIEETEHKAKTSIYDPIFHFIKHGWVEINGKLYVNDGKPGPSMYKDKDGVYQSIK